jgi:hypothetical protein
MALVKCKECGEQVSTSAKSCPKCGAKLPKKTSLITWLVLILFGVVVFNVAYTPSRTASPSSASASANLTEASPTPPPKPQWETSTSIDKMTGKKTVTATSPSVGSTERMGAPYNDVQAWLGVSCNVKSEWAYIGFTTAPNLIDTQIENGYNIINTRIKWDKSLQNVSLIQEWGGSFLQFQNRREAVSKITTSKTALLELNWYGANHPYFSFPLDGAATAITAMRKQCAGK